MTKSSAGHMAVGQGARRVGTGAPGRAGSARHSKGGPSNERPRAAAGLESEHVWRYLCAYMVEHHGRPPAARDIADGLGGRSLGSVAKALSVLEREGRIRRGRFGRARGIEIIGATYTLPAWAPEP